MTAKARRLRHMPTIAEQTLWKALRRNQLHKISFRRQHPIGPYVLDFYCPSKRIAIEVDGGQHATDTGQAHDQRREHWLSAKGIRILQFWNNEVLLNLNGVLQTICHALDQTPSRRNERADLPLAGGGDQTEQL